MALLACLTSLPACSGGSGSDINDHQNQNNNNACGSANCNNSNQGADQDQDGYPASQDCDDTNADIYPGVHLDCHSDCDNGTMTCLDDGTWTECSASTDCDCDEPGKTRIVDCGNCGQASQSCGRDMKWSMPGDCLNEGECPEGQVEEKPCPYCGTMRRICLEGCTWSEWDDSECSGQCRAGSTQIVFGTGCPSAGQYRRQRCNDQCQWEEEIACTGDCLIEPRQGGTWGDGSPDYKDEVCIPGGAFIMGYDNFPDDSYWGNPERPAHTVVLTPYLIDKYEVTVARYQECVDAGVCSPPGPGDNGCNLPPLEPDSPVVRISHDQAMTFCNWDGGRTLPTEAQWERAARGDSGALEPWGDDPPTCDLMLMEHCMLEQDPNLDCYAGSPSVVPVHSYDAGVSPFGLYHMADNAMEWVLDWFDPNYYANSPLVDPQGPPSDVGRGWSYRSYTANADWENVPSFIITRDGMSQQRYEDMPWRPVGFRCARPGVPR